MRVLVPSMRGCVIDRAVGGPRFAFVALFGVALVACMDQPPVPLAKASPPSAMRLEILGGDHTGITFQNKVIEDDSANYFKYAYVYNGGGVSAGDLDGDDLPD